MGIAANKTSATQEHMAWPGHLGGGGCSRYNWGRMVMYTVLSTRCGQGAAEQNRHKDADQWATDWAGGGVLGPPLPWDGIEILFFSFPVRLFALSSRAARELWGLCGFSLDLHVGSLVRYCRCHVTFIIMASCLHHRVWSSLQGK